jgi:predicted enzyme related to lactoylglutathione lyase
MTRPGIPFVGFRATTSEEYAATVRLYRDLVGLAVSWEDGERSTRFRLDDGAELHVYGPDDVDHVAFGGRACIGVAVDDIDAARRRLESAGIEVLDEVTERDDTSAWFHYRAPDGSVQEVVGPPTLSSRGGAEAGR